MFVYVTIMICLQILLLVNMCEANVQLFFYLPFQAKYFLRSSTTYFPFHLMSSPSFV